MKRRRSHPKKNRVLAIVIGTLILLLALFAFSYVIELDYIEVDGNFYADKDAIVETLFPDEDAKRLYKVVWYALFGPDYPDCFADIRVRPTGLKSCLVTVEETPAVAVIEREKDRVFLNAEGRVLGLKQDNPEGIPALENTEITAAKAFHPVSVRDREACQTNLTILKTAAQLGLYPQAAYCEQQIYYLVFGSVLVELGGDENLLGKLNELVTLYPLYKDLSGVLHMENFSVNGENRYYFKVLY